MNLDELRLVGGAAEVPPDIIGLTFGIDTQADGFKWLLVGWARRSEAWLLETSTILGDMAGPEPWKEHCRAQRLSGGPGSGLAAGFA